MLEHLCQSVEHALDAADLCLQVKKFTDWLEFENSSLGLIVDRADSTVFKTVFNVPEAFLPIFDSYYPGDPVMRHCKRSGVPLIWDQSTYVNVGMGDHWERQAPFGMQVGLALTVHLPGGLHVNMGIERRGQFPRTSAQTRKILAAAQLFFTHASPAALRILGSETVSDELLPKSESRLLNAHGEQMSIEEFTDRWGVESQSSLQPLVDGVRELERIQRRDALSLAQKMGLIQSSVHNL